MNGFVFIADSSVSESTERLDSGFLSRNGGVPGVQVLDTWRGAGARCLVHGIPGAGVTEAGMAPELVRCHGLIGVADGVLYYGRDLIRDLAASGVQPEGDSPAHLILAAYRAWREQCVDHLEGDFAFVLWDPDRRLLFAARDPCGTRALYTSAIGGGVAVASSPLPLLYAPGASPRLSKEGLLRVLTFRAGDGTGTAWEGVQEVPPGHLLRSVSGEAPNIRRYFKFRRDSAAARLSAEDAVIEVRRLLTEACVERSPSSQVAVAMSGGYDSTAIYGVLRKRAEMDPRVPMPRVVTLAFPAGDPGNEDAYVNAVLGTRGDSATWVDVYSIPVIPDSSASRPLRPLPLIHHFEPMNRAMARAAAAGGSHVLLNGMMGDEVFGLGPEYLADLLRRGRWMELRREWQAMELRGRRAFRRFCVRPLIPDWMIALRRAFRGEQGWDHPFGAMCPPWVSTTELDASGIVDRDREVTSRLHALVRGTAGRSTPERERAASLLRPEFGWISSMLHGVLSSEGVQLRGPLLDPRLVEFVLSRPREDVTGRGEGKILLRRAMEGLLPPEVLAPRTEVTGSPEAYFEKGFLAAIPSLMRNTEGGTALGDLGLIDPARFRDSVDAFLQGDSRFGLAIFHTLETDLWVRSWSGDIHSRNGNEAQTHFVYARSA